ncbi:MAG: prepilin-type N-terminal cleavage/methylation domain-containing protein [Candidatus Paceibacterota bacterium]
MKNLHGFTLIEVLIYLALMGLLFSGLFVSAFIIIENIGRNDTQIMVQDEGAFLMAKIEREANIAVFEEHSGDLEINGIPLNNSSIQVGNLKFASSPDGGLVTASFTLSTKTVAGKNYSRDFSTIYFLHK